MNTNNENSFFRYLKSDPTTENETCQYSFKKNLVINTRIINPPVNSESNKRYSFDLNSVGKSTFITDRSYKKFSVDISALKDSSSGKISENIKKDIKLCTLESSLNKFDSVKSINISSKNNEKEMYKYVNKYVVSTIKCWSNLSKNPGMNYKTGELNLPLVTKIGHSEESEKKLNLKSNYVNKYNCYNLLL